MLWAPEWNSVHTTMPARGRWDASAQLFLGRFTRRFPGRWVPVPWAYSDAVQMRRCAEDHLHSNVIFETCSVQPDGCHLTGVCRTVNSRLSRESAAQMVQTTVDRVSVLGIAEDAPWPVLRDGDIIHQQPVSFVSSTAEPGRSTMPLPSTAVILFSILFGTGRHVGVHTLVFALYALRFDLRQFFPASQWNDLLRQSLPIPWPAPGIPLSRGTGSASAEACYLAARGAPSWVEYGPGKWFLDLQATCAFQVDLHSFWCANPLRETLPSSLPAAYRHVWEAFPQWPGGVPHELFISTDGSGSSEGSCAFMVWCLQGSTWFRLGWFAARVSHLPWRCSSGSQTGRHLLSYHSELAALQSAGLWLTCAVDMWRIRMGTTVNRVTIAVDNASAMQVAAGWAEAHSPVARRCREIWQAVQSRCQIRYQHVHSHVGVLVNTLVDALAEHAHSITSLSDWTPEFQTDIDTAFLDLGPWLWLVPRATVVDGVPGLVMELPIREQVDVVDEPSSAEHTQGDGALEAPAPPTQLPLRILTANVQSIKDAVPNPFNPSGHAARRQYFCQQVLQQKWDIVCLQETRSRHGRWATAGVLSWRSGGQKGQYGCEVWIRPDVVSPSLTLDACRILVSTPRILLVTCRDPRLPVSVCAAHAPHADRSDREAAEFWAELREALRKAPPARGLVLGIDANADFAAPDEEGYLIGTLLSQADASRNDSHLLELCLQLGLEAPATFKSLQRGAMWSWEHTSGKRRRLDHVLFGPGPWAHSSTSQAIGFDLLNAQCDHVALQVSTRLECWPSRAVKPHRPLCSAREADAHGHTFWTHELVQAGGCKFDGAAVQQFRKAHEAWREKLPPRPKVVPRQPYLTCRTVACLQLLRDWRQQLRHAQETVGSYILSCCFYAWAGAARAAGAAHILQALRTARLWRSSLDLQVLRQAQRAHNLARKDKVEHFIALTRNATDEWHSSGKPILAIQKLRWASRRMAERRAVHSAGGYHIEAELEDQFRAQEGGQRVTTEQLQVSLATWLSKPSLTCTAALPSLVDMESASRRQAKGKAPGPDGIRNEIWRSSPVAAGEWLWHLCTGIILRGHEPAGFKRALVCALYKKGPASVPSNYRSIALLNGMAKIWHSHVRRTAGQSVLRQYDEFQLGGRSGVPVAYAVAAFRNAWDLSVQSGRCLSVLFIDIQAAYYEASRQLIFQGDPEIRAPNEPHLRHLAALASQLVQSGALSLLGVSGEETALLQTVWHVPTGTWWAVTISTLRAEDRAQVMA